MIQRILPAPLLSAALFALWLLLNRSLSSGHLALAMALALLIPLITRGLRPLPVRIRHPWTIARLAVHVMVDSLASNLRVMQLLLWPSRRKHPSGFVQIPLQMRDPNALAVLAAITCITPGSAWAELARDRSVLLLHMFELDDPQAVVATVQQRYEKPLMEIFE